MQLFVPFTLESERDHLAMLRREVNQGREPRLRIPFLLISRDARIALVDRKRARFPGAFASTTFPMVEVATINPNDTYRGIVARYIEKVMFGDSQRPPQLSSISPLGVYKRFSSDLADGTLHAPTTVLPAKVSTTSVSDRLQFNSGFVDFAGPVSWHTPDEVEEILVREEEAIPESHVAIESLQLIRHFRREALITPVPSSL